MHIELRTAHKFLWISTESPGAIGWGAWLVSRSHRTGLSTSLRLVGIQVGCHRALGYKDASLVDNRRPEFSDAWRAGYLAGVEDCEGEQPMTCNPPDPQLMAVVLNIVDQMPVEYDVLKAIEQLPELLRLIGQARDELGRVADIVGEDDAEIIDAGVQAIADALAACRAETESEGERDEQR